MDALVVDKGYEKALGAALGDDLDAPVDQSAPMRWAGAALDPSDPQLPDGASALSRHVQAPPELARRLGQIGVVDRADGPRLAALLKPGQRLVSREGDFWRWDGFAAAAHAPTGAARRLAERGRLEAIEGELAAARGEVEAKRSAVEAAEAAAAAAAEAETKARAQWREAQHSTDTVREEHADAEREIGRNAARISALKEARQRLSAGRDEANAARGDTQAALAALPAAAELERRLAEVNEMIARDRAALAEVRVEAQAIAREAELADRRLQAIAAERRGLGRTQARAPRRRSTPSRAACRGSAARAHRAHPCAGKIRRPAPGADRRDRDRDSRSAAPPPTGWRRPRPTSPRPTRPRAPRSKRSARRAPRRRAPRNAATAPSAAVADIEHEIRETLDVEPADAAELAELKAGAELPPIADVEAKTRPHPARARAARFGESARRAGIARGRGAARQARERARRPRRGDPAAAAGHPQPQSRGARAPARFVRDRQRELQEAVRRAVRRRQRRAAADRERRPARSRPRDHGQAARARRRRRCRCSPAASRRSPRWR